MMKRIEKIVASFPNWTNFNKNLARNYEAIALGGTEAYWELQKLVLDEKKVLNLSVPQQCLYMSWQVLRHSSSILKEGGIVFFLMSKDETNLKDSRQPLPLHRTVLRQWFFPKNKWTKYQMKYPFLFQPLWTMQCYGIKIKKNKKPCNPSENLSVLKEMADYCKERGLKFYIISHNVDCHINIANSNLISYSDFEDMVQSVKA